MRRNKRVHLNTYRDAFERNCNNLRIICAQLLNYLLNENSYNRYKCYNYREIGFWLVLNFSNWMQHSFFSNFNKTSFSYVLLILLFLYWINLKQKFEKKNQRIFYKIGSLGGMVRFLCSVYLYVTIRRNLDGCETIPRLCECQWRDN